jgi:hypothetical protein
VVFAGKATTSIGLASSLDRNYRRYVACERRVQYLQDPGHRGVLREDIDGEREELQKELDLVRKHRQFDIPEGEIQGNRKRVQERGFRAGRRE